MTGKLVRAVITLALVATVCRAQDDASLRDGLLLTQLLSLDQQTDSQLFNAVGFDKASVQLTAVMAAGMSALSSVEQRAAMHRATQGLIELALEQKQFMLAASYGMVQRGNYRNLDHDYEAALQASELALEHQKRAGLSETLDLFYEDLGRDYMALSRPADALANFRHAQEQENGIATDRAAWISRGAAQAEIALGNLDGARAEVAKLLATEFKGAAFLTQSDVQIADGQYPAALASIKQAEGAGVDPLEITSQLASLNLLATRSLSFDSAIDLSRRMEQEFSTLPLTPYIEQTVAFRRRLAGDTAATFQEKIAVLENARKAGDIAAQVEALSGLALLYRSLNSVSDQVATLEEARKLELTEAPAGARAAMHLRTLNQLGDAYLALNSSRIAPAQKCFAEAVARFEALAEPEWRMKAAPQYGLAILGRARAYAMDDDAEQGRKLLLDALNGLPKAARFEPADVLLLLARLERDEHRLPQAAEYYAKAISALHDGGWPTYEAVAHVEYAQFLLTAGLRLDKSFEEAEAQIVAAEAEAQRLNMAETLWRATYERGVLAEARGNSRAALAAFRASIAKLELVRAEISDTSQRQTYVDRELVQDLYSRAFALVAQAGDLTQLWDLMERAKARSFLDSMGSNRFHASSAGPDSRMNTLQDRVTNAKLELQPTSADIFRSSGQVTSDGTLESLERELQQARETPGLAKSRAGNAAAAHPLPLDELYKLLPAKTALLEFGFVKNGLLAVIATRNGSKQILHPTDAAELRRKVTELTQWLDSSEDGTTCPALQFVSDHVLAPFWPFVEPGIDHLIIVPTGFLNYIPFPALRIEGDRMLIDSVAVSYLPSASVIQFVSSNSKVKGKVFLGAIGNAVTGKELLPGTLNEVNAIIKVYPGAERAYEGAFTHDRALRALLENDLVHFATHGELSKSSPLLSSLLTAPAPGQLGQLSVYELPALAIRAKTVVLSACKTALGEVSNADEIPGLTRALLTAGADTVVSSLWRVSDRSTAILMEEFHRQLQSGANPSDALRTAGLRARKEFPAPHHWAAFIVTGAR